mgnify:CR=1 FL=1
MSPNEQYWPDHKSDACVAEGAAYLARIEPRFAQALEQTGPLPLRLRKDGFAALLDAIVSQQVSVASARAIWDSLHRAGMTTPDAINAASAATDHAFCRWMMHRCAAPLIYRHVPF